MKKEELKQIDEHINEMKASMLIKEIEKITTAEIKPNYKIILIKDLINEWRSS